MQFPFQIHNGDVLRGLGGIIYSCNLYYHQTTQVINTPLPLQCRLTLNVGLFHAFHYVVCNII